MCNGTQRFRWDSLKYPVAKNDWDSGAAYAYIHKGDVITVCNKIFDPFTHYVAEGVEMGPEGRFPVLIVRDAANRVHRLNHHVRYCVRSGEIASASSIHDDWINYYEPFRSW
jgi:hypothetical protein